VNWRELAPDLQQGTLEMARFAVAHREGSGHLDWIFCTGGMAEYRAGQWERSIELCKEAEAKGFEVIPCKGAAMVHRAMGLMRLGREDEARKVLAQAEEMLANPIRTRSGSTWWDLDICQLALEEARQVVGQPATR
jgi:hypothetical protein